VFQGDIKEAQRLGIMWIKSLQQII
jgi:hypothetical protein